MSGWQSTDTAPRDGRWFLLLKVGTIVGGGQPWRANPELLIIRRYRSNGEGDGYWQSIRGHSVADDYAKGLWAETDALPLRAAYGRLEQRRLDQGGEPMPLPVPYENAP